MTREEILKSFHTRPMPMKDIKDAMDMHAKEMIMAYEVWLNGELDNDSSFNYNKTPEQLYKEFIQSLTSQINQ